jgi:hypothetical protein
MVHSGQTQIVLAERQATMDQACAAHPYRFARAPRVPSAPAAAWINAPSAVNRNVTIQSSAPGVGSDELAAVEASSKGGVAHAAAPQV